MRNVRAMRAGLAVLSETSRVGGEPGFGSAVVVMSDHLEVRKAIYSPEVVSREETEEEKEAQRRSLC